MSSEEERFWQNINRKKMANSLRNFGKQNRTLLQKDELGELKDLLNRNDYIQKLQSNKSSSAKSSFLRKFMFYSILLALCVAGYDSYVHNGFYGKRCFFTLIPNALNFNTCF